MSDNKSKPSTMKSNPEDNESNPKDVNLKEDSNDGVVTRVIEVFDGEILR